MGNHICESTGHYRKFAHHARHLCTSSFLPSLPAPQPKLKTSADRVAGYEALGMFAPGGPVTAATLAGGNVA